MSSSNDSAQTLVARFLRQNNYEKTLDAFIEEAGLPPDAGSSSRNAFTLEKILDEKRAFDLSNSYEKTGVECENKWTTPAPSIPMVINGDSNVLHVSIEKLGFPNDHDTGTVVVPVLLASKADKELHLFTPDGEHANSLSLNDSPILSCLVLDGKYSLTTGMSGQIVVYDWLSREVVGTRRDHTKYVVKATCYEDHLDCEKSAIYLATAAWDAKVNIYILPLEDGRIRSLDAPVATINLPTNPEDIILLDTPELGLLLLATRRDSTKIYFYRIDAQFERNERPSVSVPLLGTQNLAPYANAWVAFSPSSIALCPTDDRLLAVATTHTPHMKIIIVRLLLPKPNPDETQDATQASQARRELEIHAREEAAILIQVPSMAPQTTFSTPVIVWRHDGSGVWVNGDDGVIRGIEASTGKVVSRLKGGHEPGKRVRCLWTGLVPYLGKDEEWVVSGGFDKKVVVWKQGEHGDGDAGED
jgi:WD40 repeat protein